MVFKVKYFFIIIIINFECFTAPAQFIFTSKKPIETLVESIDKYESSPLKDSLPFAAIRIIDSRYDTTHIGFYLDGFLAIKDSSQPIALQHTIDKYYHNLYTPGKDTLLIQLEKLSIQDAIIRDTNFILTVGYVSCKEYTGSNNRYKYIGSVDTMMREKLNYHTTYAAHKNGKHFNLEFWDYYLLRLSEAMITGKTTTAGDLDTMLTKEYSLEEIKSRGLQKRIKPILTTDSLKPGFYQGFSEFINNNPGFLFINGEALNKLLEVMHYRVGKKISNEVPDTTYWGYCDGKKLFIRYGYNFYQLEKKDAGYYIAATLDARRRDVSRSGWNLLAGLATLSAGIAADKKVELRGFSLIQPPEIPMVALPIQNGFILGLQLDWDTGEIIY